jgi:hypothetical protein
MSVLAYKQCGIALAACSCNYVVSCHMQNLALVLQGVGRIHRHGYNIQHIFQLGMVKRWVAKLIEYVAQLPAFLPGILDEVQRPEFHTADDTDVRRMTVRVVVRICHHAALMQETPGTRQQDIRMNCDACSWAVVGRLTPTMCKSMI